MHALKVGGLVGLLWALALGAHATVPAAVGDQPAYVAAVEVVQSDASVPAGFAEELRTVVLSEAALYGSSGRALAVRIDVSRIHFKNPVQAMLIGDNNDARGQVVVRDAVTGEQLASFQVRVDAERSHGISGAGVAMGILELLDPTGIVGIGNAVGNASSADINHSGTVVQMRRNLADETLRRTFGDTRTRAVIRARQEALRNAPHPPRETPPPSAP
jgi:hypothetical protein